MGFIDTPAATFLGEKPGQEPRPRVVSGKSTGQGVRALTDLVTPGKPLPSLSLSFPTHEKGGAFSFRDPSSSENL